MKACSDQKIAAVIIGAIWSLITFQALHQVALLFRCLRSERVLAFNSRGKLFRHPLRCTGCFLLYFCWMEITPERIKTIKRLLILIIVAVSLAAGFSYWRRARTREGPRPPEALGPEVAGATREIEYAEHRRGQMIFRVRARRYLETRGGKHLLEGIEAQNFGHDGARHDEIRSDFCSYDERSASVDFKGNVVLRTTEGIEVRADALNYDKESETARIYGAFYVRRGRLEGRGRKLEYGFATGDVSIAEGFEFAGSPEREGAEPVRAGGLRAYYYRNRGLISLRDDVSMEQGNNKLAAEEIDLILGDMAIERVEATGNPIFTRRQQDGGDSLRGARITVSFAGPNLLSQVRAANGSELALRLPDWDSKLEAKTIVLYFNPDGSIERLYAEERNRLELSGSRGSMLLGGEKLDATFDSAASVLRKITVAGRARALSGGAGRRAPADSELTADKIQFYLSRQGGMERMESYGKARWRDHTQFGTRALAGDSLEIDYQKDGRNPRSLSCNRGCAVELPAGSGEGSRRIEGERIYALFTKGSSVLESFSAQGGAEMTEETGQGPLRLWADKLAASFSEAGEIERLELEGNSGLSQGGLEARGQRALLNERRELALYGEPVITRGETTTHAGEIFYHMEKEILQARGGVRTVSRGPGAALPFADREGAVFISASSLQAQGSRAVYSGGARAAQGEKLIAAERFEIDEAQGTFAAAGGTKTILFRAANGDKKRITITAPSASYSMASRQLSYQEGVVLGFDQAEVRARKIRAELDESGEVEKLTAEGEVRIKQPGRGGSGSRLDYFVGEDKYILSGEPAEIIDEKRGKSQGKRLTFYSSDGRISIDSK